MKLKGKYKVVVKENDFIVNTFETENIIVDGGLQHIVDWFVQDNFSEGKAPCVKAIDTTGMTVTNAGFSNPSNCLDGSSSSYTSATIDSASWDNDWWTIDFGETKKLMALFVEWAEDDSNRGADYKFQYSADNLAWTDFDVRLRPPQESNIRGKVLFFTSVAPPFEPVSARYIRLNTKRGDDNETFYLYQLKFYEDNFAMSPPGVMALGVGSTSPAPSGGETSLRNAILAKTISNSVQPSGNIARFVMSLDGTEGNGNTFTEVGMFASPRGYDIPASGNSPTMFSRAVFPSGWLKSSGQTADVYYDVSVENN